MMISANDVLQVINEIHQYSMLLLELKDATTFGILHSGGGKVNYFRLEGKMGRRERIDLVQKICGGIMSDPVFALPVDQFVREIEGKKARHIWLETVEPERKEMAFVSISELKSYLKSGSSH
jgi:hypothetical protein